MKSESVIRRSPKTRPKFAGFRRYVRKELRTDVMVQDLDGWEVPLESLNLSPTGMFVESDFLFEIGDKHVLIFCSPETGEWFRIVAEVVRVEDGDDDIRVDPPEPMSSGMAYEFLNTDDRTWSQLCQVLGC